MRLRKETGVTAVCPQGVSLADTLWVRGRRGRSFPSEHHGAPLVKGLREASTEGTGAGRIKGEARCAVTVQESPQAMGMAYSLGSAKG